jgi:hypothetical protein
MWIVDLAKFCQDLVPVACLLVGSSVAGSLEISGFCFWVSIPMVLGLPVSS